VIELSICIATYNRAAYLRDTLENILPQLTEATELVIVDGASTDDTPALVATFVERDARIRYHRQPGNGGVDRDFAKAVELAQGRYCWLFSDDDMLKPYAIERVLARAREAYSLIVVNAEVRNADLSAVIDANRVKLTGDATFEAGSDDALFVKSADYLTFIGGVVIDRQLWMQRQKEPYFGSAFIHVGVIFQAPLPRPALIIAEPLIVIRYGNASWSSRGFEIWMFKWPSLVWSLPLGEEAKRSVVAREPWRRPANLLLLRAVGAYSKREYESLIAPRAPRVTKMLARLVAMIPGRLLNAVARLLIRFVPRPTTTAIDLRNARFGEKS